MKKLNSLIIKNIVAQINGKNVLKDISLEISPGSLHVIMGPNGSGKSTLAQVLLGNPVYKTDHSQNNQNPPQVFIGTKNITDFSPDAKARAGIFLAFQSPISIPGVSVLNLLRASYQAINNSFHESKASKLQNPALNKKWNIENLPLGQFIEQVKSFSQKLSINESLLNRSVHDGFSGGEKKKIEMLQALVLQPKYAIFDEIDTGLDVDALKVVANGINELVKNNTGVIVITHYQRIVKYLKVDKVHILINGFIKKTGDKTIISQIEKTGFSSFK